MTAGPDTAGSLRTDHTKSNAEAVRLPHCFFQMIKVQIIQSHGIGAGLRLSSIAASVS